VNIPDVTAESSNEEKQAHVEKLKISTQSTHLKLCDENNYAVNNEAPTERKETK
jgi:hypothetical protein